jgi:prophage DNA circulation protein
MATACYQPTYLPASYKGVPFDAMEVSSQHGRRGAEGEFPFGENTGYADLGRKIRTYSVRGRFATNDHVARSAALIAVCEIPGPGALVHPTRGIVTVACRSITVTDNPLEAQGVTFVDMDFVEANVWGNGFSLGSLLQTGLSLVSLIAVSGASFSRDYQSRNAKPYNHDHVLATASGAITDVRDEYHAAAVRGAATNSNTWSALADLERRATDISVLEDAEETFRTIRLGMSALSSALATDPVAMYQAFLRIANESAQTSQLTGQDQVSEDAVYGTVRALAAGYMARAALQQSNVNAQDTFKQYRQISSILEQEIEAARVRCDNDLYLELRNFYVGAQTALLNRIYTLPALVIYNFRKPVHALVAAYEIYNDAKRAGEIANNNPGSAPWSLAPRVVASRS